MFENVKFNFKEIRILIIISLIPGIFSLILSAENIAPSKAVLPGIAAIHTITDKYGRLFATDVIDNRPCSLSSIKINSSSYNDLTRCPGISKKIAERIIKERKFKKFFDWRDLQDRVKGIGKNTVSALQEAGVKL